jgi:hypothetical protein
MMNRQVSTIPAPSDPRSASLDNGNAAVERQHQAITTQPGDDGGFLDQWNDLASR